MSSYKQLKQAADMLDKHADALEQAGEALDQAQKKLAQERSSLQEQEKTASDQEAQKAEIAPVAKQAASALLEAGLLSSQEQADVFASQILGDHKTAMAKIAQLAQHAGMPKRAAVVPDSQPQQENSADDVWEKHARGALSRLHIG